MGANLYETHHKFEVRLAGKPVVSWTRRLWEPTGTDAASVTYWRSRERTQAERAALRAHICACLDAPAGELVGRLLTDPPFQIDDSRRSWDRARPERQLERPEFSRPKYRVGRPRKGEVRPPEYYTTAELALHEIATWTLDNALTRPGLRQLTTSLARAGIVLPALAAILGLTETTVRALIREELAERRTTSQRRPAHLEPVPYVNPDDKSLPLRKRVQRLWYAGWRKGKICKQVGISSSEFRELRQPRVSRTGPCQLCASAWKHIRVRPGALTCVHYNVTWAYQGNRIKRLSMTAEQAHEALRDSLPAQQAVFPAWGGPLAAKIRGKADRRANRRECAEVGLAGLYDTYRETFRGYKA